MLLLIPDKIIHLDHSDSHSCSTESLRRFKDVPTASEVIYIMPSGALYNILDNTGL